MIAPHKIHTHQGKWYSITLPAIPYTAAQQMQHRLVAARIENRLAQNIILWLEHPPVYTLGRRGNRTHLHLTALQLEERGIKVVSTERGGDITYHGPGQLIVYPIIDVNRLRLDIPGLVERLEAVMIETAGNFGVKAHRKQKNRGVWVGNQKLGSIGIALRHGISFHGMAFNVNLDLAPFEGIDPCGLKSVRMTSLQKELQKDISLSTVREICQQCMSRIFGFVPLTDSANIPVDIIGQNILTGHDII